MRRLIPLLALAACSTKQPASGQPLVVAPSLHDCDPNATWPPSLRMVTWNIEATRGSSLDEVAAVLESIGADVMMLQEVDVGVSRTNGIDTPRLLADRLHAESAFAEAIPWDGGHYGLAILSRLPFHSVARIPLQDPDASEDRIGLDVTLCAGPTQLRVVGTHLDVVPPAGAHNALALENGLASAGAIGHGLLVGGDFNALPADPGPMGAIAAGLTDLAVGRDTSPTWEDRREDYLFADSRLASACNGAKVVVTDKSDHDALQADFSTPF